MTEPDRETEPDRAPEPDRQTEPDPAIPARATLRVFVFHPMRAEPLLDMALRDELLPRLRELQGLHCAYIARRGPSDGAEHVIASVWHPDDAIVSEGGESSLVERFDGQADDGARLEVLPIAVTVDTERSAEPAILRIFRGRVRPGELDAYLEDVRHGARADAAINEGLLCLHLGTELPDRFVTVSAWTGWEPIELATGGNIRRPMTTRNAARIDSGEATHYETIASGTTTGD